MFPETEKYSKNSKEYEKALLYLVSVGFFNLQLYLTSEHVVYITLSYKSLKEYSVP